MSYTPENQRLDIPLENTIKSIDSVCEVIHNRQNASSEWLPEHLDELVDIECELIRLRRKLIALANTTS